MDDKNFKDIVLKDGDREVKVRLFKMDCVSSQEWLIKFGVALANAGVPLPKKIAESVEELGAMLLSAVDSGAIFRMPGLTVGAVKELLYDLHNWAAFIVGNGKMLPASELAVLKGQLSSASMLFRLEAEIVGYSFGFFEDGGDLESKINKLRSSSPPAPMSPPSSPPL